MVSKIQALEDDPSDDEKLSLANRLRGKPGHALHPRREWID